MSFFGTNIKKIRQVKGLSQKAFADLFDLNRGVISSYEEGRAEPKIETILKVASHFNLNLDKLLTETLQVNQLASVSDIDQLMFFPELAIKNGIEKETGSENNSANTAILQKILASVDLVYEFTPEKPLISTYHYGDILFLNKTTSQRESSGILFTLSENFLEQAPESSSEVYKIVGSVSTSEKNVFTDIFTRLEALEKAISKK
ncbi:MAG: helix-turn-helix domain-containing protein [Chryseobacterium sp.]|jgi:transcriptional regulator with XRE-family HTH domain|nr:helix-turn-helix transcriptional regulator [Chryseobacterium sp.]MDR2237390.1 helix-turn-helix domain-containing protein [Chryseobacterium sp.]